MLCMRPQILSCMKKMLCKCFRHLHIQKIVQTHTNFSLSLSLYITSHLVHGMTLNRFLSLTLSFSLSHSSHTYDVVLLHVAHAYGLHQTITDDTGNYLKIDCNSIFVRLSKCVCQYVTLSVSLFLSRPHSTKLIHNTQMPRFISHSAKLSILHAFGTSFFLMQF